METPSPVEMTDGTLLYRTPVAADAEIIAAAVRETFPALAPWLPWAKADHSAEDIIEWINRKADPTSHPMTIWLPDGTFVGNVGLNKFDGKGCANLGYWLRSSMTGHGYATRATNAMIGYGRQLGVARIEVVMSVGNEPSRKVAERSEAVYEGIREAWLELYGRLHDVHVFAAL